METKFRKHIRLKHYDYASNGYYFVTIVTQSRLSLLEKYRYGSGAIAIARAIKDVRKYIKGVEIDYFIVMDNHVHIIFVLEDCKRPLGQIIKAMKYNVTKIVAAGLLSRDNSLHDNVIPKTRPHSNAAATKKGIWQPNYYEHIIREYVVNNPEKDKIDFERFYDEI